MILYKNKGEAKEGSAHINEAKALRKIAVMFAHDPGGGGFVYDTHMSEWKVITTYPRAAITRNSDFPELQVIVVNCQALLPTIALDLKPDMTKEERDALLFNDLQDEAYQIVGRAMRSSLPRIPGETVHDPRKKLDRERKAASFPI